MAYTPLAIDSQTPEVVRSFIRRSVDMQLHDVHCMLRLPDASVGLDAGCNFAAANFLLAIISGCSVTLYEPNPRRGQAGRVFRETLQSYCPWEMEPADSVGRDEGTENLYLVFRNPLAHAFGIQDSRQPRRLAIRIGKGTYPEDMIEAMERSPARPRDSATVRVSPGQSKTLVVEGLY